MEIPLFCLLCQVSQETPCTRDVPLVARRKLGERSASIPFFLYSCIYIYLYNLYGLYLYLMILISFMDTHLGICLASGKSGKTEVNENVV